MFDILINIGNVHTAQLSRFATMQFTLPLGERGTTIGTRYSAVKLLRAGAIQGVRGDALTCRGHPYIFISVIKSLTNFSFYNKILLF